MGWADTAEAITNLKVTFQAFGVQKNEAFADY
jgi:hypothetical protein